MVKKIVYLTTEDIMEYNLLAINLIKVKKADRSELLSYRNLVDIVEGCKKVKGDIYDRAVYLLKGIIQNHPFASGNRRTAFITVKDFLLKNNKNLGIKDDPKQAKVMTGIREGFYIDKEIKEWLKNGKIRQFRR